MRCHVAVAQCISHCVLVVCGTSCLVGFSWVCSMYSRLALNSPSLFSFFSFLSTGLIGTSYCAWCSRSSSLVLTPWSSLLITCISPYTVLFMSPFTTEKMSSSSKAFPLFSSPTWFLYHLWGNPTASYQPQPHKSYTLSLGTCDLWGGQSLYPKPKSFLISVIIIFSRAPNKPP